MQFALQNYKVMNFNFIQSVCIHGGSNNEQPKAHESMKDAPSYML